MKFPPTSRIYVLTVHCVFGLAAIICAQEPADEGTGDPVASFLGTLQTYVEQSGTEAALADWTARERRIATQVSLSVISREKGAAEYYALGKAYLQARRYEEGIRLLRTGSELSPGSYAAARSCQLIGMTYYGNLVNSAGSLRPLEEADRIYQQLLSSPDELPPASRKEVASGRAAVLGLLGSAYRSERRDEDAIRTLSTLVESPDLSQALPPESLLNLTQSLARTCYTIEDTDAAPRYYSKSIDIMDRENLPASLVIGYRLEALRRMWDEENTKERVAALVKLWNDPRYTKDAAILAVGDELTTFYFFHNPRKEHDFKEVSTEWLIRARPHRKAESQKEFTTLDAMFVRNLLMAVEFQRTHGPAKDRRELIQEFETVYKGREVRFTIPSHQKREHLDVLYSIYVESMTQHARDTKKANKPQAPNPTLAP